MELDLPNEVATALVGLDPGGGVIAELPLKEKEKEAPATALAPEEPKKPEAVDDGGNLLTSPWLWMGVAAVGAVIVVGGSTAAGVGIAVYQPSSVSMQGEVQFAGGLDE